MVNAPGSKTERDAPRPSQTLLAPAGARDGARPVWIEAGATLPDRLAAWRGQCRFDGEAGSVLLVPDEAASRPGAAIVALGAAADPFALGALAGKLPAGDWYIANPEVTDIALATLGFCLGGYRFDRYRPAGRADVRLVVDDAVDADRLASSVDSIFLTRDLINTPANDMGPDAIEAAARALARHGKASIKVTTGEDLLGRNFPLVYMVGRASRTPPRLIDMRWGRRGAPRVTLVGKGVAFDTGGLNIKPASAMRNMKKDMGGAANVLGLARMIMDAGLDVRLRVLIPAVENAISGNAFRPGDVLPTRKGLTVEIGNTDAEGRLVLADALTLADEEKPELIVDMATLTGAARVALGPELPPFFTDDDDIADRLARAALKTRDPLWRMPLWRPYERNLSSTVADCANVTTDGFAGSVTAALFLSKFVAAAASWVHFDVFGWNPTSRPHAPVGGEAHGIRALFSVIEDRFGSG